MFKYRWHLCFFLGVALSAIPWAPACAAEMPSAIPDRPDFTRHIVPLFTRLGCNAGTCHGAVKGQNGFRLSLFGANPALDHEGLLREYGGRRLNLGDPDESLLLRKATGSVPHAGGRKTAPGLPEYALLRTWIAQGSNLEKVEQGRVVKLEVTPTVQTLKPGESYTLKVQATFPDGSVEDVTTLSTYEALERNVATIDSNGRVQAQEVGDTALLVRFGSEPVLAQLIVPRPGSEPFPEFKANNFIDDHIRAKLQRLNLHPSGLCDDATFLRRVSLDITGALPTPEEIRKFLGDSSGDKRTRKIDELLARPGHASLWATKFCDLLKVGGFNGNYAMSEAAESRRFYAWIRARLEENTPYDAFVGRILTATSREGRSQEEWLDEVMALSEENARMTPDLPLYAKRQTLDLYWQREKATGMTGTLQVAHAFLGLRLECAQCHRHPHDVWQQDDLLSFANFFMRTKGAAYPDTKTLPMKYAEMSKKGPEEAKKLSEESKKLSDRAKEKSLPPAEADRLKAEAAMLQMKASTLTNGPKRFGTEVVSTPEKSNFASVSSPLGTQKSDKFRLLGEKQPVVLPAGTDPRAVVLAWMKQPDNPFFARAIVNRVWAHYFGRGLVDPADHLSPLNPPSHPELLTALAEGFVKNKYDLRWLHRTIVNSRTYQLSCETNATNRTDRRNFAAFYLRRMPAEILVDAINDVTGGKENYPPRLYLPPTARALEVAGVTRAEDQTASVAFPFQIFGRPLRNPQVQCDCERDPGATIVQSLFLANHPQVRDKIAHTDGRLGRILNEIADDAKRIEELFLLALGRLPSAEDLATSRKYIQASPTPKKGYEDLLWSLLNTREFILNH